jgi:hypothetical protein
MRIFRPAVQLLLLAAVACLLAACGKNSPALAQAQKPNGDPEMSAEAQIQKLLGELNTQEMEVAKLIRAAGPNLTVETRNRARAARYEVYLSSDYVKILRSAQAAVQNKITGRATERAALDNAQNMLGVASNALVTPKATNAPPDEQAEEFRLKARLLDLQTQTEDLVMAGPVTAKNAPAVQQKAASAREEIISPEEYEETLGETVEALERKLSGLNAEAAFYENLLGLDSSTNTPPKR